MTDISPMAHSLTDAEHRWGGRIRVSIPIHVASPSTAGVDGRIKNLSLSGALITTHVDLPLNSRIEVTLELPSPRLGAAVIAAHVARKVNGEVGIEWCQFAPNAVKDLLRAPSVRLPV
jgi:PilZ domain-containing protein